MLSPVILRHFASWGTRKRIFDPLIPRRITSGPFMQVRTPGTPLIPTRKIVSFLGIRAGGGRRWRLIHQPRRIVISIIGVCVRKNPGDVTVVTSRQLVTTSLSSGGERHEVVINLMEWPLAPQCHIGKYSRSVKNPVYDRSAFLNLPIGNIIVATGRKSS